MTYVSGRCLCGAITFEADARELGLYRCHCSLCRRQSGASSNAATIVPLTAFRWLSGEQLIRSWVKDTGFRSDFCSTCGSPVPNRLRDGDQVWIPAGLLDDTGEMRVVADVHVASAASWDTSATSDRCYEANPPVHEFFTLIRATNHAPKPSAALGQRAFLELVTIIVEEYDPAIAFFVGVLQFELLEDSAAFTNDGRPKRWVVVKPKGSQTGILLARADGPEQARAIGDQTAGRVGFFLRVDDFESAYERLTTSGVRFVTQPRTEAYGQVAVFLDIAGNRWDLLGPQRGSRRTSRT